MTRAAEDARYLCHALEIAGLTPIRVPLIERQWDVLSVAEATTDVRPDWVVVTSPTTADVLASACPTRLGEARFAAVGPGTVRRLELHGWRAELTPQRNTAADLVRAMGDLSGKTVLYARADLARSTTAEALRAAGAAVIDVVAYRNVAPADSGERLLEALPVDVTTLLSGSAAQRVADAVAPELRSKLGLIVAIGPSTGAAAEQAGLSVDRVADPHTVNGLVEAVIAVVD